MKKLYSALFLSVFIFCIDRISKVVALANYYQSCHIVNQFLSLEVCFNRGVAWSLFHSTDNMTFIIISLIQLCITGFVLMYAHRRYTNGFSIFGELLIITGALANLIDRMLYGGVVDFIVVSYQSFSWPVFNIADMAIVCGVAIIIFHHEKYSKNHYANPINHAKNLLIRGPQSEGNRGWGYSVKIVYKLYFLFKFLVGIIKKYVRPCIMPSLCANCKKFLQQETIFCGTCKEKIFPIVSKKIDITPTYSATVFALSDYKDPLKKLILAKGWSDYLASYQMGVLLSEMESIAHIDCDVIVPIPLHWTRYAYRGFNQATEIARVIGNKKKIPMVHLLKRIKKTAFQSTLVSSMRVHNLKDAFVLTDLTTQKYKDKHILLVDDLMTTGSTIISAAKKLLELKPRKITIVVVCRVI